MAHPHNPSANEVRVGMATMYPIRLSVVVQHCAIKRGHSYGTQETDAAKAKRNLRRCSQLRGSRFHRPSQHSKHSPRLHRHRHLLKCSHLQRRLRQQTQRQNQREQLWQACCQRFHPTHPYECSDQIDSWRSRLMSAPAIRCTSSSTWTWNRSTHPSHHGVPTFMKRRRCPRSTGPGSRTTETVGTIAVIRHRPQTLARRRTTIPFKCMTIPSRCATYLRSITP
mmetsp:Transcript_10668/g.29425  ORF Transcript_10668/g.29425 Transcript_10668/m.29425 type:complete len:224 (-) Transcript_10668:919-1590(-)